MFHQMIKTIRRFLLWDTAFIRGGQILAPRVATIPAGLCAEQPRRYLWAMVLLSFGQPLLAGQVAVLSELERLANTYGFTVVGAWHIAPEARGWLESGDPYQQVRGLLDNFAHIIVQRPDGSIERVIVLGGASATTLPQARPVVPPDDAVPIVLNTQRSGRQHLVPVALETSRGQLFQRSLLLDTGADLLVLPASLIGTLGLNPATLSQQPVQTANGLAPARIGTVPALWLGERRLPAVAAAFIDDRLLGHAGLLGMSALSQFRLTVDDRGDQITLSPR